MSKSKKRTVATPDDTSGPLPKARALCERGLHVLDACIGRLSNDLTAPRVAYDVEKASHLAWLTKNASQIMGELRKLEQHDRVTAKSVSPQLVLAYLRGLPDGEWSRLVREVEAARSGESVLA